MSDFAPDELASDGDDVVAGIDPPSDEELLAYLEAQGFGPGDEVLLSG